MVILYQDSKVGKSKSLVTGFEAKQVAAVSKGNVRSNVGLDGNLVGRFAALDRTGEGYGTLFHTYRALGRGIRGLAALRRTSASCTIANVLVLGAGRERKERIDDIRGEGICEKVSTSIPCLTIPKLYAMIAYR